MIFGQFLDVLYWELNYFGVIFIKQVPDSPNAWLFLPRSTNLNSGCKRVNLNEMKLEVYT